MTSNRLTEEIGPFPGSVDCELLLDHIESIIKGHLVLPKGAAEAAALWCLSTYCINNFRIFPKLFIFSPIKGCGKTTALEILSGFTHKSLPVSGITPAVVFRVIEIEQPTLMVDEADQHLKHASGDMTAILNSGHTKSTAFILRSKPKTLEPQKFSTWAPMSIAAIGTIQSTIMDRSITIPLQRMTNQQKLNIQKVPYDFVDQMLVYRQKLLKWSQDNEANCRANIITPLDIGNNRAQDNWTPLFTLAALIGPKWLTKCEKAYRLLEAKKDSSDPRDLLLKDIQVILKSYKDKNITSEKMISFLTADSDSIWTEYSAGKAITPRGLAALLKDFGIKPKTIRRGNNTNNRGYKGSDFDDAFKRYI